MKNDSPECLTCIPGAGGWSYLSEDEKGFVCANLSWRGATRFDDVPSAQQWIRDHKIGMPVYVVPLDTVILLDIMNS